jgi:hypothetical protein
MVGIPIVCGFLLGLGGCGDDEKPVATENTPPVILSLTAEPDTFYALELCTITAVAEDPDDDPLQYGWAYRHSGSILVWVSATSNPAVLTTCSCNITEPLNAWVIATIDDGNGGMAQDSIAIVVLPPPEN